MRGCRAIFLECCGAPCLAAVTSGPRRSLEALGASRLWRAARRGRCGAVARPGSRIKQKHSSSEHRGHERERGGGTAHTTVVHWCIGPVEPRPTVNPRAHPTRIVMSTQVHPPCTHGIRTRACLEVAALHTQSSARRYTPLCNSWVYLSRLPAACMAHASDLHRFCYRSVAGASEYLASTMSTAQVPWYRLSSMAALLSLLASLWEM